MAIEVGPQLHSPRAAMKVISRQEAKIVRMPP